MPKHLLIGLALLGCFARPALAEDGYRIGPLQVDAIWSRETPPVAATAAVYLRVHNNGPDADRLLAIDTPLAGEAQMHENRSAGGLMQMQPLASVALPAGADTTFAPEGKHIMLMALTGHPRDGDVFPMTLHFETAGALTIQVAVHRDAPPEPAR